MENNGSITTNTIAVQNDHALPLNDAATIDKNKRKKKGSFNFFKALLTMRRRSTNEKPKPAKADAAANDTIKKIVGSMRPLHLQDNQSPPPSDPAISFPVSDDQYDLDLPMPQSPPGAFSSASSSGGLSRYASVDNLLELENKGRESRYASALNLQALDNESDDDDDENDDNRLDANGGDEMIDAKADAFIAQFYHQMRLQGTGKHTRHNTIG